MDFELWMCPDDWQARGISWPRHGPQPISISRNEELGSQEVTLYMMPEGAPSGEHQEIEMFMVPATANELACYLCGIRYELEPNQVVDKLIAILNDQRAWAECSGYPDCQVVERDWRCDSAAKAYLLEHIINGSADGPGDYVKRYGLEASDYCFFVHDIEVPLDETPEIKQEDCEAVIALLVSDMPGIALKYNVNISGGYFIYRTDLRLWKICLVLAVDDSESKWAPEEHTEDYPDSPCSFKCAPRLQYYVQERNRGVIFRVFAPDICQLWKIELWGDVNGIYWKTYCQKFGANRCRGQAFDEDSARILAGEIFEVNTVGNDPFPGELMTVWGYMDGLPEGTCNPVLLAWNYYAHPCFTSGLITLICLLDENRSIIDSRDTGTVPDKWIGDERLAFQVACEGESRLVRPSDFYAYTVGERVLIHKGGLHQEKRWTYFHDGAPIIRDNECYYLVSGGWADYYVAGCQDPDGRRESEIFSWKKIRRLQDDLDGCIIPMKLYGVP